MEKLKFNYNGTGIKTLRAGGMILMFGGVIGGAYTAFGISVSAYSVIIGFIIIVSSFVVYGACNALATIAENALYKTKLMMHKLGKEGISFELEQSAPPQINKDEKTEQ